MKWFFAFNQGASSWFEDMIKVAVISAREKTTLSPLCLYDGTRTKLTDWLTANGVNIIGAKVPFCVDLYSDRVKQANSGSHYSPEHASGTFLKIQSCFYEELDPILITDCDVMFMGDPTEILGRQVSFAAVAEGWFTSSGWTFEEDKFNAGILYCSPSYVREAYADFLKLISDNNYYFKARGSYDQTALNMIFSGKWEQLPPVMNWRPVQGLREDVKIVHFHGPKPHRIKALIEGAATPEEMPALEMYKTNPESYKEFLRDFYDFLSRA